MKKSIGACVEYMLLKETLIYEEYSVQNLIEMGLFHSKYRVYNEIYDGKLQAHKIHQFMYIVTRSDLLAYWKKHRKEKPGETYACTLLANESQIEELRQANFQIGYLPIPCYEQARR